MIVVAKKSRKKQGLLVEKIDKAVIVKVAKVSSVIDISNKYRWAINNIDIDVAGDLKLTGIKKYWKCIGQI